MRGTEEDGAGTGRGYRGKGEGERGRQGGATQSEVPAGAVGRPEVLLDGLAPGQGLWRCGCRAFEGQRPARPRASVPGPVSASCKLLPTFVSPTFHGWGPLTLSSSPPTPPPPALPGTHGAVLRPWCSCSHPGHPRHLSFCDVSHDSAHAFPGEGTARPVRLFRVSYVSGKGRPLGQVRAGLQVQGGDGSRDQRLKPPDLGSLNSGSVVVTASPRPQPPAVQGEWKAATPPQPLWAPVLVKGVRQK